MEMGHDVCKTKCRLLHMHSGRSTTSSSCKSAAHYYMALQGSVTCSHSISHMKDLETITKSSANNHCTTIETLNNPGLSAPRAAAASGGGFSRRIGGDSELAEVGRSGPPSTNGSAPRIGALDVTKRHTAPGLLVLAGALGFSRAWRDLKHSLPKVHPTCTFLIFV